MHHDLGNIILYLGKNQKKRPYPGTDPTMIGKYYPQKITLNMGSYTNPSNYSFGVYSLYLGIQPKINPPKMGFKLTNPVENEGLGLDAFQIKVAETFLHQCQDGADCLWCGDWWVGVFSIWKYVYIYILYMCSRDMALDTNTRNRNLMSLALG